VIGTGNDVATLNSLIATTIDSIDGYQESAKATEDMRLKDMFETLATDRRQAVEDMRARVTALGGNPEDDGTVLAAAHRKFVDLKSMVTGRDDKAIVNEVERGEDHIKSKFESAIADDEISSDTRAIITKAFESVRRGHDAMSQMKHSMEASHA
jgi:uncharacterized protein (TIGR02284 family)